MQRFYVFLMLGLGLILGGCGGAGGEDHMGGGGGGGGSNPDAPVLSAIGDKYVLPNNTLSFSLNSTDANSDTVTYSITGIGSPNITTIANSPSFSPSNGNFSWVPTDSEDNSYAVRFTATDNSVDQLTDEESIIIYVLGPTTMLEYGYLKYEEHCAECHGSGTSSEKNGALYIDIYEAIFKYNYGNMKTRLSFLTTPQIEAIAAYLQTF